MHLRQGTSKLVAAALRHDRRTNPQVATVTLECPRGKLHREVTKPGCDESIVVQQIGGPGSQASGSLYTLTNPTGIGQSSVIPLAPSGTGSSAVVAVESTLPATAPGGAQGWIAIERLTGPNIKIGEYLDETFVGALVASASIGTNRDTESMGGNRLALIKGSGLVADYSVAMLVFNTVTEDWAIVVVDVGDGTVYEHVFPEKHPPDPATRVYGLGGIEWHNDRLYVMIQQIEGVESDIADIETELYECTANLGAVVLKSTTSTEAHASGEAHIVWARVGQVAVVIRGSGETGGFIRGIDQIPLSGAPATFNDALGMVGTTCEIEQRRCFPNGAGGDTASFWWEPGGGIDDRVYSRVDAGASAVNLLWPSAYTRDAFGAMLGVGDETNIRLAPSGRYGTWGWSLPPSSAPIGALSAASDGALPIEQTAPLTFPDLTEMAPDYLLAK